jgi:hypothetical protein
MNQVKTITELINRTWRAQVVALVLTLFVFLLGTTTARAQGHGAGTGGGAGKVAVHDIGLAAGVGVRAGKSYGLLLGSRMIKLKAITALHVGFVKVETVKVVLSDNNSK